MFITSSFGVELMENNFFTARTVDERKLELHAIHAGAAWVYVDSWETFFRFTTEHTKRLIATMSENPISQFGYLLILAKHDETLALYEPEYLRYLANLSCATGQAEKLLCRTLEGKIYASYLCASWSSRINRIIQSIWQKICSSRYIRFKHIAQEYFNGEKGAYYWAKAILEHLVYIGLARNQDKWSVEL